ncbi:MAG: phosphate signaling complex protein PhoU [Kofleriaceae bacterium]|nr:phosphate signaling complex protein PhoU [Kofleriaceae bacterium]
MPGSKKHTNREFEAALKVIRDKLVSMGEAVEEMIGTSVDSLLKADKELAKKTIARDHHVNRLEVDTDDLCLVLLAKRQPMASDLRFITLAMKMVTDLERIGDLAVNISERTLALDGFNAEIVGPILGRMAKINRSLIRDAIESFIEEDPIRAETVIKRDSEVDQLYLRACNEVRQRMKSEEAYLDHGIHLQAAAKFLERIGDHITNLAELVIFMVWGKDIRHLGSRGQTDC